MKSFHGASFTMREEYEGRSPKYFLRSLDRIQNIKESSRRNLDYIHLLKANSTTISLEEALVTNLHNLKWRKSWTSCRIHTQPLNKNKSHLWGFCQFGSPCTSSWDKWAQACIAGC